MTAAADPHALRTRRIGMTLALLAALSSVAFGLRSYGSFILLRSAYEAGAPQTSGIRPWMTLGYVAETYRLPEPVLLARLGAAPGTASGTSLKTLAERQGLSPRDYVARLQRAIAGAAPDGAARDGEEGSGWLRAIADWILTGLILYGYPALALTLLLGSIGLPLPDGIATAAAGSLAAQGHMSVLWAATVTVTASLLGDAIGYLLGRVLDRSVLERHGRWLGYTPSRRVRVDRLFLRWGVLTVLLTRTFVSYLSSVVSLLAGAVRFRLSLFLAVALLGRLLWTAAYLGLGYAVGADLDADAALLTNLTAFLLSLTVLGGAVLAASGRLALHPTARTAR